MHNLACLVKHLHLLLGVVVLLEHIDVRDEVVGKLVGELLDLRFTTLGDGVVLLAQLLHSAGTSTTCRLICCHTHALDVR